MGRPHGRTFSKKGAAPLPGRPPSPVLAWHPPPSPGDKAIDPSALTAVTLAGLYRSGALSPVEAARACLDRIARLNPRLNAVIALDEAGALAAATRSEARWREGRPAGPLDGVPLTVKDNIPVAGLPCRWGSPAWPAGPATADELPVARLRAGGAVILGKTNVPEFTLEGYTDNALFGPTGNPWDPRLTPGGSSGGAVTAVASGMGPLALGTDGGGSIRRPASHTGLVGLKPTPGRVPRTDGLPAILLDLEVIGPIARTVADAALLLAAMAGPAPEDPASHGLPPLGPPASPPRLRILYVPRFGASPVDPGIAASVATAARRLEALGHAVEEEPVPFDPEAVLPIFPVIASAGLAWLLGNLPGEPSPASAALVAMAKAGREAGAPSLFAALDAMAGFRRDMGPFLARRCDAILTPSAAALPWPARDSHPPVIEGRPAGPRGHAVFTNFANLAGLPAIALLAVAAEYEAAHPWADRWPALS